MADKYDVATFAELQRRIRQGIEGDLMIEWTEDSEGNDGQPAWSHIVGKERPDESTPWISVRYGRGFDCMWRVLLAFDDDWRKSDPFETQEQARAAAESLVVALRRMWP